MGLWKGHMPRPQCHGIVERAYALAAEPAADRQRGFVFDRGSGPARDPAGAVSPQSFRIEGTVVCATSSPSILDPEGPRPSILPRSHPRPSTLDPRPSIAPRSYWIALDRIRSRVEGRIRSRAIEGDRIRSRANRIALDTPEILSDREPIRSPSTLSGRGSSAKPIEGDRGPRGSRTSHPFFGASAANLNPYSRL